LFLRTKREVQSPLLQAIFPIPIFCTVLNHKKENLFLKLNIEKLA